MFADEERTLASKEYLIRPFATQDHCSPLRNPFILRCTCTDPLCTCGRLLLPAITATLEANFSVSTYPYLDPADNQERPLNEAINFNLRASGTVEASRPAACACYRVHAVMSVEREGQDVVISSFKSASDRKGYAMHLLGVGAGTTLESQREIVWYSPNLSTDEGVGEVLLSSVKATVTVYTYPFRTMAVRYLRQCILEAKWTQVTEEDKGFVGGGNGFQRLCCAVSGHWVTTTASGCSVPSMA